MNTRSRVALFFATTAFLLFLDSGKAFSQITLVGDFRTRTEYRHGFQTLMKEGQDHAFFTSQRSRIILGYKDPKYTVRFSVQDIRTWGSQSTANASDNLLSVHEAWVEYFFTKKFSLKGGRQELAYDNHRILGNLDWAQQGRKHDVALLKFTDSTFAVHAGFAFNQDKEQSTTNLYTVANNYKAMQFLWLNKQWKKVTSSFLFMNHGTEFTTTDEAGAVIDYATKYSQTIGLNNDMKFGKLGVNAFAYYQTGKDNKNRYIDAYDLNVQLSYNIAARTQLSVGAEKMSGTTNLGADDTNHSFNPFYGTNHAFNGYMDYFYVGNHVNNVGLSDVYVRVKQNAWKGFIALDVHQFATDGYVTNPENSGFMSRNLGTEVDLTIRQNISKELSIQGGYSQMFGTSTMGVLKSGDQNKNNNWAYLWIIFKPDFLKKKQ
jgi:hypothetical protein